MIPERFPTTIQSTAESRAGPTIDAGAVRPGDVLETPAGDPRVVTGTGYGPTGSGVALFHPDTGEHRKGWTEPDVEWTMARLSLGVVTTLVDGTQYVLTAGFHPDEGYYDCALGATALGGTHVRLADHITTTSPASLSAALEQGVPSLGEVPAELRDHLDASVASLSEHRLPAERESVPAASLSMTGPVIPTGTEPSLVIDDSTVAPGDRFVGLSAAAPADPTAVDSGTLAAGTCTVVLRQSDTRGVDCVELVAGERADLDPATLVRRRREATYSLELLARESFVDPLSGAETVSVHCYRVTGECGPTVLLAGARRSSTTPRLDHPLALPCCGFDSVGSLSDALATPRELDHPLGGWAAASDGVVGMCQRVASRLED